MPIENFFAKTHKTYTTKDFKLIFSQKSEYFFLKTGKIDFFLKKTGSALYPLFQLTAGDFFSNFFHAINRKEYSIFFRAQHDTLIQGIEYNNFLTLLHLDNTQEESENLMSVFFEKLIFPLKNFSTSPNNSKPLNAEITELSSKECFFCPQKILWIKLNKGKILLLSETEENIILPSSAFVPLTSHSWLTAIENSSVEIKTTNQLKLYEVLTGIKIIQQHVFRLWLKDWEVKNQESDSQHTLTQLTDTEVITEGLLQLSSVLEDQPNKFVHLVSDNLLFNACQKIANYKDILLPPFSKDYSSFVNLDYITHQAQIRTRKITLSENWEEQNEPLLCFNKTNKTPVALLPANHRKKYDLYNPQTEKTEPLSIEKLETLEKEAIVFYNTLEEPITKKRLLHFSCKNIKKTLWLILGAGTAIGLLSLLIPYGFSLLLDHIIPQGKLASLFWLAAILITAVLVSGIFFYARGMGILRITGYIDMRLQSGLWDRLLRLPADFFRHYLVGDLAIRALGFYQMRSLLTNSIVITVFTCIFSFFYLVMMIIYNMPLMFIGLGMLGLLLCLSLLAGRYMVKYVTQQLNINGILTGFVLQVLQGISKLRVASGERRAFSRWAIKYAEQQRMELKRQQILNLITVLNSIFPLLTGAIIFLGTYSFWQTQTHFSTGAFVAFNTAFMSLLAATQAMNVSLLNLTNIIPLYQRLKPILNTLPETNNNAQKSISLIGKIDVQHLKFRYNEQAPWILSDISLQVNPGELIALVGYSGSGKSTLLRLLLGFEQAQAGFIYLDKQDLSTLNISELRTQIGVVLQNGKLFPGSIFDNIIGASAHTLDDAWETAKKIGLAEVIEAMPMGMHTFINEGVGGISGGQRQLILIARALINNPKILFFDEATSALDAKTQALVTQSLQELHATRIIIAHRLSTVKNADRIYVLREGKIVEHGNYQELMNKDGYFAELAKRQLVNS